MSKIRLVFLGLLAVLVVSVGASASASATMPAYTTEAGSLIAGKLGILTTKAVAGSGAFFKTTLAGIKIEIECKEGHGTGWVENSATTEMGLGLGLLHYLKCTFTKAPAPGCVITNELIHINLTHGLLLLGGPTGYLVDVYPDETIYTELVFSGCTIEGFNGTYPVTGSERALVNNTNLTIEFTANSGSELRFAGKEMRYEDILKTEMLGGGGIVAENGS